MILNSQHFLQYSSLSIWSYSQQGFQFDLTFVAVVKCSFLGRGQFDLQSFLMMVVLLLLLLLDLKQKGIPTYQFYGNFPSYPLLFEPNRLLVFKNISSFPVFSPKQMKKFPSHPLLLETTRLLNLKKKSSLPFYQSLPLYQRLKSM